MALAQTNAAELAHPTTCSSRSPLPRPLPCCGLTVKPSHAPRHNLGIELQCTFATPDIVRDAKAHLAAPAASAPPVRKGTYHNYVQPCRAGAGSATQAVIKSPLPHTCLPCSHSLHTGLGA